MGARRLLVAGLLLIVALGLVAAPASAKGRPPAKGLNAFVGITGVNPDGSCPGFLQITYNGKTPIDELDFTAETGSFDGPVLSTAQSSPLTIPASTKVTEQIDITAGPGNGFAVVFDVTAKSGGSVVAGPVQSTTTLSCG
jgi:hypothetical protein